MSLKQREQLLIVWYIFSSFSSVSSNDYNQVFFLILQWAKEQRIVQRVSLWGALCWMVSNTWGSGLQVGVFILLWASPGSVNLSHQPFSSTLLSHSQGEFHICLLPALLASWIAGRGRKILMEKRTDLKTVTIWLCPPTHHVLFLFLFFFPSVLKPRQ